MTMYTNIRTTITHTCTSNAPKSFHFHHKAHSSQINTALSEKIQVQPRWWCLTFRSVLFQSHIGGPNRVFDSARQRTKDFHHTDEVVCPVQHMQHKHNVGKYLNLNMYRTRCTFFNFHVTLYRRARPNHYTTH